MHALQRRQPAKALAVCASTDKTGRMDAALDMTPATRPSAAKPERFQPFELVPGPTDRGILVLADHARNTLPAEYGTLGLPPAEFERHIAYDIGTEAIARGLAERLGAPMLMSCFSRLLIDPNRGEDDPTLVMRLSDGTVVPGNHPIRADEIERRIARFHRPYHDAIDVQLDAMVASGTVPIVVAVHSFTPFWKGTPRPWQIGFLADGDRRAHEALLAHFRADPSLTVGDNEPYSGALRNDTMFTHATRRGLAQALVEVRQDLVATPEGQREWTERLADALDALDRDPQMHERRWFGSMTGPVERIE